MRALVVLPVVVFAAWSAVQGPARDWPAVTRETRPWTRWWWHGSAVDRASLTAELETLRAAGIGGVEITPIYGVRGEEAQFIPFLSDGWVDMLAHTLREAGRLDVGVDMATGTGWPFGGPWVGDDLAPRTLAHKTWTVEAGQRLAEPVRLRQTPLLRLAAPQPDGRRVQISDLADPVIANPNLQALALDQVRYPRDLPLSAVVAYGASGAITDLTVRVGADRALDWTAPERSTVYAVFTGWHGKLVERAAPGGEGNVIDHFARNAIRSYLARFDRAFARQRPAGLRAFFNDSYEVDDASGQGDWTPLLFEAFQSRRGYDLRRHLPALFGRDVDDASIRVLADYRETVSDLLLETFTTEWRAWARRRGGSVRNQAHGSPANLLDLYAASDIPETEGNDLPRFKWATSAAHVAGRRLVSAEAATWLGEHFRSTLADVRAAVDLFFLAGVNHIVYHGTAYSPPGDPWPGRQFYAAVEFNSRNAWWDDFAALNQYVTRAQSFLQAGRPDTDVLLYFPFYDSLATRGNALLTHFGGANARTAAKGFEDAAAALHSRGFTYDYISDLQLAAARVTNGRVRTGVGSSYSAIVLPPARYVPEETLDRVLELARLGATVVVWNEWPSDVSGARDVDARRGRLRRTIESISFGAPDGDGVTEARIGRGRIVKGAGLDPALARAGVVREALVDRGLMFARRVDGQGRVYFVSNRSDRPIDGWVPFQMTAANVTVFDPMSGRRGAAQVRPSANGGAEVYLQIPAAESLIVAASSRPTPEPFEFYASTGTAIPIAGPWDVRFVKGGPSLPAPRRIDRLESWTAFGGEEVKSFSGTVTYTATFPRPVSAVPVAPQPRSGEGGWQLDLGRVHESARVRLNGRDLATLIGPAFRVTLDLALLAPTNTLEVTVTNLTANRIADLDRRGVPWKKFYNVNMPSWLPANRGPDGLFTAANWDPLESGLIGPVTLTALVRR